MTVSFCKRLASYVAIALMHSGLLIIACGIRFRLPEDGFVFRETGLPEEFALLPEDRFVFRKTKSVFQKTDRSSRRPKRNMHKFTKNSQ